jgi:4-hydroxy-tetrahydrodipicolinate synthase
MLHGASGVVSVLSNVCPHISVQIFEACRDGQFKKAVDLYSKVKNFVEILFCESNPIPTKFLVSQIFSADTEPRLPLLKLSSANQAKVMEEFGRIKELGVL